VGKQGYISKEQVEGTIERENAYYALIGEKLISSPIGCLY